MKTVNPWRKPESERTGEPVDHSVIAVDYGFTKIIAMKWGLAKSTVSQYLNGNFTDNNPSIELIKQVRAYAKKFVEAESFYIVTDRDGTIRAFKHKPRRDNILGKWFDPLERHEEREKEKPEVPKIFIPHSFAMTWDDKPFKLQVKIIPEDTNQLKRLQENNDK